MRTLRESGRGDAARARRPPEVVAQEVRDHDVLRAVLRGREEPRAGLGVGLRGRAPGGRALDRLRHGPARAEVDVEEELRRVRDDRPRRPSRASRRTGTGLSFEEIAREREGLDAGGKARAGGQVDLVDVAPCDAVSDGADASRPFVRGERALRARPFFECEREGTRRGPRRRCDEPPPLLVSKTKNSAKGRKSWGRTRAVDPSIQTPAS